jgi:hypothetical protein
MVSPPRKLPYISPMILWLVGFFPLMAFVGRGKLSLAMGLISVAYLLLLPTYLLGTLSYNFVVHPKRYHSWEKNFMCQRCGTVTQP